MEDILNKLNLSSYILTDTGIALGDEGKGRLIYELYEDLKDNLQMVFKVNGGANSGHTINGHKLNLLPSSLVIPQIPLHGIGSGVVADPMKMYWEIKSLESKGFDVLGRLIIDERCMLSDLSHRLLDLAQEDYRVRVLNQNPRGTTARGITPSYSEEINQSQIFYYELISDFDSFSNKLTNRINKNCDLIKYIYQPTLEDWQRYLGFLSDSELKSNIDLIKTGILQPSDFDFTKYRTNKPFNLNTEKLIETYRKISKYFECCIQDIRDLILKSISNNKFVLGEFGQSYWLDKRFGFSPNVSASHTTPPELFNSCNIPVSNVHNIGVIKAYDTGVGSHFFPTEFEEGNVLGDYLKTLEFGTTTGRQRTVGWFDALPKGEAIRYGGVQELMLNKIDVLRGDHELKICYAYTNGKKEYLHLPRDNNFRKSLKPVYWSLPAWTEDVSSVRVFDDLPLNAKVYISHLLKAMYTVYNRAPHTYSSFPNLRYIGVGPNPNQVIRDIPPSQLLIEKYTNSN